MIHKILVFICELFGHRFSNHKRVDICDRCGIIRLKAKGKR